MTVANAKPDQIIRGPLGTATVNAASSAWWDVSTVEAKISEAIAYAVTIGAKMVYVPDCFLPYNASLVTFNPAVRMTAEGADPGVLHGLAYGMDVTGATDIGPSLQAMVNYATKNDPLGAGGPELVLPAGILAWNTTVNIYTTPTQYRIGAVKLRGQGGHATIVRPTIAPMLLVGGVTGSVVDGFAASDFNIEVATQLFWADGLIHLRLCRLWHFARIQLISGTNPVNDLYTYTGYLFHLDSSYNGQIERCNVNGKGMYLFEFNDNTDNNQQCDTVAVINCICIGMCMALVHAPTGATDDHNIEFINCKYLMINTWDEANVSVETTLTSSPAAGLNTFTIASATGLAIGDHIWIGIGSGLELVKIGNLVGTTVTPANALRAAHTSGEAVLMGGFMVSTAPKCHGVWLDHPHLEFCAMGIYNGGGLNARVTDAYGTVKELIRNANGAVTTYGLTVERGEWHWGGAGVQCAIRVTTAGDNATNQAYMMYGPFMDPNTGSPPTTLFQNDAGTTRAYRIINAYAASSNAPALVAVDPTASSAVLLESRSAGGVPIYERDLAGSQYMWRQLSRFAALTDAATVAVDASQGDVLRLLAGGSRTIGNPTNRPANGRSQFLTIVIFNNTAGAITTTWSADYLLAGAWVDPALSKRRSITFEWDWLSVKWVEAYRTAADA